MFLCPHFEANFCNFFAIELGLELELETHLETETKPSRAKIRFRLAPLAFYAWQKSVQLPVVEIGRFLIFMTITFLECVKSGFESVKSLFVSCMFGFGCEP